MIQVSAQADEAFGAFDFAAHKASGSVRIYLRGFG
jgi:hypothetical protein